MPLAKGLEEFLTLADEKNTSEEKTVKVLIIIPAYNEEQNLEKVMERLKAACPQYDYVIINDGSTDRTGEICETNRYHVIHHPVNQGLARAIQTGMKYALEHDYDMALQFDRIYHHL